MHSFIFPGSFVFQHLQKVKTLGIYVLCVEYSQYRIMVILVHNVKRSKVLQYHTIKFLYCSHAASYSVQCKGLNNSSQTVEVKSNVM